MEEETSEVFGLETLVYWRSLAAESEEQQQRRDLSLLDPTGRCCYPEGKLHLCDSFILGSEFNPDDFFVRQSYI